VLAAGAIGALGQALGYAQAFALAWGAGALALLAVAFGLRHLVLSNDATP